MSDKVTISLIVLMVARELWDIIKQGLFKKDSDLKASTEATIKNTLAIEYLRVDVAKLSGVLIDLNEAHTKIRSIDERLKNLEN